MTIQSLKPFVASTTFFEKADRVTNYLIFPAAVLGLHALTIRKTKDRLITYSAYFAITYALRKIFSAAIGYMVYPAWQYPVDMLSRLAHHHITQLNDFTVRNITLYKSGVRYAGFVITKPGLDPKKWSMHAFGNAMAMEHAMSEYAKENANNGCNTLLLNGPSVGNSGGFPTRYAMGAGFEAGMQFLEKEMQATHLIFNGLSLGSGMLSEAVLSHTFQTRKVRYLAISDRTFADLVKIAKFFVQRVIGSLGNPLCDILFHFSGTNLRGVAAAHKLSHLRIQQIVIQSTLKNDGVIPKEASLLTALRSTSLSHFTPLESPDIRHNDPLPKNIQEQLDGEIREFLSLPTL